MSKKSKSKTTKKTSGKAGKQTAESKPKELHPDPHVWIKRYDYKTTKDVPVPGRLIDQVLGQDQAVAVAKKAAEQKRHLLLIGDPGTGKSMLAKAMTEVLPQEVQRDVLTYHNPQNPNAPKIMIADGGQGKLLVDKYEHKAKRIALIWRIFEWTVGLGLIAGGLAYWWWQYDFGASGALIFLFAVMIALLFLYFSGQKRPKGELIVPKLLIEHTGKQEPAPYVDGTGSHAGALLGDVRHDPFQSGGLETPSHQRVEVGAIHRAHKGILFIDEINVLRLPSQQALLTAMQDHEYSIVGQSQSSSGAMIRTEPVPCDFILVAAGNLDAVEPPDELQTKGMHPALRSRIRGYGYEVYVNSVMEDTHDNREKLIQFVAQEVVRDGKIPHFDMRAVAEIIREGQRRSGSSSRLTLRLRELGGLVRTAGDYARAHGSDVVTLEHVREAKSSSRSLEQQITETQIRNELADMDIETQGSAVGVANGLGVVGTGEVGEPAGFIVPVEAAVVPALSRHGGSIVLGQTLKDKRGSGVENVGAMLKNLKGADIADHDVHVDAHIAHPDATAEGIGIAAAVATVSALEAVPVKQEYVFAGTLAVSGELRPVRSTLQRIEAAAFRGFKKAIIPHAIRNSLLLDDYIKERIEVVFCRTIADVLEHVLDAPQKERDEIIGRLRTDRMSTAKGASNGNGSHGSDGAKTVAVASNKKAAKKGSK